MLSPPSQVDAQVMGVRDYGPCFAAVSGVIMGFAGDPGRQSTTSHKDGERPMTALPVPTLRRVGDRLRNVAETVYSAPAPASGPGIAAKSRHAAYVLGSALAWALATFVVIGVLASIFH